LNKPPMPKGQKEYTHKSKSKKDRDSNLVDNYLSEDEEDDDLDVNVRTKGIRKHKSKT